MFFCDFNDILWFPWWHVWGQFLGLFSASSTWGAKRRFEEAKVTHFGYHLEASGVNLGVFL